MSDLSNYIAPISTLVFIVFGVFGYGWFRILKETNVLLKEQNEELKAANKDLTEKRLEDIGKLASMQGQIDVLKSIPLVNIDSTFKQIAEFNIQLRNQFRIRGPDLAQDPHCVGPVFTVQSGYFIDSGIRQIEF